MNKEKIKKILVKHKEKVAFILIITFFVGWSYLFWGENWENQDNSNHPKDEQSSQTDENTNNNTNSSGFDYIKDFKDYLSNDWTYLQLKEKTFENNKLVSLEWQCVIGEDDIEPERERAIMKDYLENTYSPSQEKLENFLNNPDSQTYQSTKQKLYDNCIETHPFIVQKWIVLLNNRNAANISEIMPSNLLLGFGDYLSEQNMRSRDFDRLSDSQKEQLVEKYKVQLELVRTVFNYVQGQWWISIFQRQDLGKELSWEEDIIFNDRNYPSLKEILTESVQTQEDKNNLELFQKVYEQYL